MEKEDKKEHLKIYPPGSIVKQAKKKNLKSYFGVAKGLGEFKREEIDRFETKWKKKYK